jgi:hypothetical protein
MRSWASGKTGQGSSREGKVNVTAGLARWIRKAFILQDLRDANGGAAQIAGCDDSGIALRQQVGESRSDFPPL